MDVFKVEPIQGNLGSPGSDKLTAEVSFDAGSEFNLSFFSQEEGSSGQGGFSDPGSVGSGEANSPPPVNSGSTVNSGLIITNQEIITVQNVKQGK